MRQVWLRQVHNVLHHKVCVHSRREVNLILYLIVSERVGIRKVRRGYCM